MFKVPVALVFALLILFAAIALGVAVVKARRARKLSAANDQLQLENQRLSDALTSESAHSYRSKVPMSKRI